MWNQSRRKGGDSKRLPDGQKGATIRPTNRQTGSLSRFLSYADNDLDSPGEVLVSKGCEDTFGSCHITKTVRVVNVKAVLIYITVNASA